MGRRKEEVKPTPQNEAKAHEFMTWYADNLRQIRHYIPGKEYNEDIASDAFLRCYNAIARGGTIVSDYLRYFLKTYRATFLDSRKALDILRADEVDVVSATVVDADTTGYEEALEVLQGEIQSYVRTQCEYIPGVLFEIYMQLYPRISYKRMAAMFGLPCNIVWKEIGEVRKKVACNFGPRRSFLLA